MCVWQQLNVCPQSLGLEVKHNIYHSILRVVFIHIYRVYMPNPTRVLREMQVLPDGVTDRQKV